MIEEIIHSFAAIYNDLATHQLHLTMTANVASSLAQMCHESGNGQVVRSALAKIISRVASSNAGDGLFYFPLRFFSNGKFFYYFVLAKQSESGFHIEMLFNDDSLRERFL